MAKRAALVDALAGISDARAALLSTQAVGATGPPSRARTFAVRSPSTCAWHMLRRTCAPRCRVISYETTLIELCTVEREHRMMRDGSTTVSFKDLFSLLGFSI